MLPDDAPTQPTCQSELHHHQHGRVQLAKLRFKGEHSVVHVRDKINRLMARVPEECKPVQCSWHHIIFWSFSEDVTTAHADDCIKRKGREIKSDGEVYFL